SAFVVHTQPAADIHRINGRAQLAQLHVIACRLAHAGLDILDIGDLRPQVKVQHAQAIQAARLTTMLHGLDQLWRTEAELGLFAPRILPVTLADTHQAYAQT